MYNFVLEEISEKEGDTAAVARHDSYCESGRATHIAVHKNVRIAVCGGDNCTGTALTKAPDLGQAMNIFFSWRKRPAWLVRPNHVTLTQG